MMTKEEIYSTKRKNFGKYPINLVSDVLEKWRELKLARGWRNGDVFVQIPGFNGGGILGTAYLHLRGINDFHTYPQTLVGMLEINQETGETFTLRSRKNKDLLVNPEPFFDLGCLKDQRLDTLLDRIGDFIDFELGIPSR